MPDRVKCFVCLGKDSDLLADYDVCCNVCGASAGDALDAAWDTIELLEAHRAGVNRAIASLTKRADELRFSLVPDRVDEGRSIEGCVELIIQEIQAAESASQPTNEVSTREELIDD